MKIELFATVKTHKNRILYWLRLFTVGLLSFYLLFSAAFAWTWAERMVQPAQHAVCCATPESFGAAYENVTLTTVDGIKLSGWYIPSQNSAAVILLHGYGGDRTSTLVHAEMLSRHGFGVLLYDQRASGESQGESLSWGWRDIADVEAALAFLRKRPEVTSPQFGVLGCSTGAEIAIGAGAQFDEIGAVIADGAYYADIRDTWPPYAEFKDWLGWPVYPLFLTFMEWRSGASAPMSLTEAVAQIAPRPLLLIAAGENGYEQWRAERYYRAALQPKEYWVVEGADHCGGPAAQPEAYETHIVSFFNQLKAEINQP
ncbi:MAG: hypothetical protein CVU44_02690 [Chloroflexi bacterium HGW-Chloroflexi-6]|nr:MAG: hypothetical protein CVU44_02690 [Chloroflexi bacterium HGW-Chloroflexi-6]